MCQNIVKTMIPTDQNSRRIQKIYTTGCEGRDIADLKPLLTRLDAVLIDVRFVPAARQIEWRKTYLQILLKEKYRHLPQLGSRTFRAGKPSIQNLDLGIRIISSMPMNLVMMCGCAESEMCHRSVIGEELRRLGWETEELGVWKTAQNSLA